MTSRFTFRRSFLQTAGCDVDLWRQQQAKAKVDGHAHNATCQASTDWREGLARPTSTRS
jgi:hypothetical protein